MHLTAGALEARAKKGHPKIQEENHCAALSLASHGQSQIQKRRAPKCLISVFFILLLSSVHRLQNPQAFQTKRSGTRDPALPFSSGSRNVLLPFHFSQRRVACFQATQLSSGLFSPAGFRHLLIETSGKKQPAEPKAREKLQEEAAVQHTCCDPAAVSPLKERVSSLPSPPAVLHPTFKLRIRSKSIAIII